MNYLIKVFQLAYLDLINFLILCTSRIKWILLEFKHRYTKSPHSRIAAAAGAFRNNIFRNYI